MLRTSAVLTVLVILGTGGCSRVHPPRSAGATTVIDDSRPNDWKAIASDVDADRIGKIGDNWQSALADVRAHGGDKAIASEGALLDPNAALPRPAPPPGVYHCRVVRLGLTNENHTKAWAAFKPFFCFVAVEGPLLTFTKGTGTHRPGGRLWDDGEKRMVFLGSVSAQPDGPLPPYGDNPMSNQIGVVERIGDFRWRMVLPGSTPEAKLDVMELLPDAPDPVAKSAP
ncbi:DUF4893 domain-containing protein [Sphingomonas sp.]|uniref:DUF4893 domain-containing protein n=1 Tax=Sphingomonas sp. TaxID=28214 RepID=UPI0025E93DCA|nr:DUF4893 domain-containing protein [Sphingomonas sp.]